MADITIPEAQVIIENNWSVETEVFTNDDDMRNYLGAKLKEHFEKAFKDYGLKTKGLEDREFVDLWDEHADDIDLKGNCKEFHLYRTEVVSITYPLITLLEVIKEQTPPPVDPVYRVCKKCGSDALKADALAEWNVEEQAYELVTTFDNHECDNCGESGNAIFTDIPASEKGAK